MDKHGWFSPAGILALVVAITLSPGFGHSMLPPRSYKKVVSGEEYLFVMLAPTTSNRDDTIEEAREIRRVYSRSGLYRNDGSTEPL